METQELEQKEASAAPEARAAVQKVQQFPTVASVPAGTIFRLHKSGTVYIKMRDGSIRNFEKFKRKLAKLEKKETKQ
jgi:hypothetical protein